MPWFKTNVEGPKLDGNVLKAEVARETVLEYIPPKIQLGTPKAALAYVERSKAKSDFVMAEPLKRQTGVDEIEMMNEDQRVELKVLQKLKDLQEKAYQEAYQLGLEDGKKLAFDENTLQLEKNIGEFREFLNQVAVMKSELVKQNEKNLIELVYQIASKICMKEMQENSEGILAIIQQVLATIPNDEKVIVKVSEAQNQFIQDVLQHQQKVLPEHVNVQYQVDPSVQVGGCIVETNYSTIDASMSTRLQVVWDQIQGQLPVAKPKLVS